MLVWLFGMNGACDEVPSINVTDNGEGRMTSGLDLFVCLEADPLSHMLVTLTPSPIPFFTVALSFASTVVY